MLRYQGKPLRRIQYLWSRKGKEAAYFVETENGISSVVPMSAIGADGGIEEIMKVANETRGNILPKGTESDDPA